MIPILSERVNNEQFIMIIRTEDIIGVAGFLSFYIRHCKKLVSFNIMHS